MSTHRFTLPLALLFASTLAASPVLAQVVQGVIPNQGQWPSEVVLQAPLDGGTLWVTRTALVYDFVEEAASSEEPSEGPRRFDRDRRQQAGDAREEQPLRRRHVVRVRFDGATGTSPARLAGEGASLTRLNYFIGNDPARHATGVPVYEAAVVPEVYPGVALRIEAGSGRGGATRLRFESEGAEPLAAIRLDVDGATPGARTVETVFGMRSLPHVEAWDGVQMSTVSGTDTAQWEKSGNANTMHNGNLVYSSYLGGISDDFADHVVPDGSGGTIISGGTISPNFPFTSGSGQAGNYRGFVARMTGTGTFTYITYLGGEDYFFGNLGTNLISAESDGTGGAVVAGFTDASDFPVTPNAAQSQYGGEGDVFVARLSSTGTLDYATYLGGSQSEELGDAAVDASGGIVLIGYLQPFPPSTPADFPVTVGAVQTQYGGGDTDGFAARISSTGTLSYATYLGGDSVDDAYQVTVDKVGNAVITGFTESPDFPLSPGAAQTQYGGGGDGFVVQLAEDGALVYASYLGGSSLDYCTAALSDGSGGIIVAGETSSGDFPTTPGVAQTQHGGARDAFVVRLSSTGTLAYATYLGGSGGEGSGWAEPLLSTGEVGSVILVGFTRSPDFPVTPGAAQAQYGGEDDVFVARLSSTGTLDYATYLGGSDRESSPYRTIRPEMGVADGVGGVFITGVTRSSDFPVTSDAAQTELRGLGDIFVTRITSTGTIEYSTYLGGVYAGPQGPTELSANDNPMSIAVDDGGNVVIVGLTDCYDFPTTPGAFDETYNGGYGFDFGDAFVTILSFSGDAGNSPDLVVSNLSIAPETALPGASVEVSFDVFNQGGAPAQPSTANVRLNQNPNEVTADDLPLAQVEVPAIEPNASVPITTNVTLPADLAPGSYFVWVIADVNGTAGQEPTDEANDYANTPLTVAAYGTTIITHGLNPLGDGSLENDQAWTLSMAEAILARIGSGRIFIVCGDAPCYSGQAENEIVQIATGPDGPDGEQIVVFDWLAESNNSVHGLSEGAANALVALLLRGSLEGKWDLDRLHFIGHSRGTVVMSEAIQRLGAYASLSGFLPGNLDIDPDIHFTTLDSHPWDEDLDDSFLGNAYDRWVNGDFYVDADDLRDGVVCWRNVAYADNYWQDGEGPINLEGLPSIPGCSYSVDLTTTEGSPDIDHGGVHTWYYGTIDHSPNASEDGDAVDSFWYPVPGYAGTDRTVGGYNRARSLGGDIGVIPSSSNRPGPLSDATLNLWDVHNADFTLSLVNSTTLFGVTIPGWDFQGGGGGRLGYSYDMPSMRLYTTNPSTESNWTFIRADAEEIVFNLHGLYPTEGSLLEVALYDREEGYVPLRTFPLTSRNYGLQDAPIPTSRRGKTQRIRFRVISSSSTPFPLAAVTGIRFRRQPRVRASLQIPFALATPYSRGTSLSGGETNPPTLHAYDAQGRHTGVLTDSTFIAEIPESRVFIHTDSLGAFRQHLVLPPAPEGSPYRFEVIASLDASPSVANLSLEETRLDAPVVLVAYESVMAPPGGALIVTATDLAAGPDLGVDADGDGTPESTIPPSEVLFNRYVDISVAGPGSVEPGEAVSALNGETVMLTFVPESDAEVEDVLVDGVSVGPVETYTFEEISADHLVEVTFATSTAAEGSTPIDEVVLSPVFPNPTSESATARFAVPSSQQVRLDLFDVQGRRISTLVDAALQEGWHAVSIPINNLSSGTYVLVLHVGSDTLNQRFVVVR